MVSNFSNVVHSVASARGMSIVDSDEAVIWRINRDLDTGKMSLSSAMSMLRGRFGYKQFTNDDYRKIEREMRLNRVP